MADDDHPDTAPPLSLIVPVYGVEAYIADCLDSIIDAKGFADHCELIIVDDGSLDGSMTIAEARCAGLPNVTIIRQANAGLGAARNTGMAHARGRYVWFVDSDDEICPDALATLARCVALSAPDIIAFEFATIGGTLNRAQYLATYDHPVDPIEFMTSGRPPSPVQFYAFSRGLIDRAALAFEPGLYHEDALFTPLALVNATSIVRLRDICYRYRMRTGSIMSLSHPEKHLSDMLLIAELLSRQAAAAPIDSPSRKALAREVGFALAAVRHYAVRTNPQDRCNVAPLSRLAAAGARWWRHFAPRALINYARLLSLAALRDGLR